MNTALITQSEFDQFKVDRHKLLLDRGIPMDCVNGTWILDEKRYEIGVQMVQDRKNPGDIAYEYSWAKRDYGKEESTTQAS